MEKIRSKWFFMICIAAAVALTAGWVSSAGFPFFSKKKKSQANTNVAAVRGLDELDPGDTAARDYASLEKVENVSVSDDDITAFSDSGGLKSRREKEVKK